MIRLRQTGTTCEEENILNFIIQVCSLISLLFTHVAQGKELSLLKSLDL